MWHELGRAVRTWCAMHVMGAASVSHASHLDYGATVVIEQSFNPFVTFVAAYISSTN
jgi:hypothetical protein